MSTTDQVYEFMLRHQREVGMPPTLEEIQQAHPTLSHRSSALYAMRSLVGDGRVREILGTGQGRRYRAVDSQRKSPDPAHGLFQIIPVELLE